MVDADKYNFHVEHIEEASQSTKEFLLTVFHRKGAANELSLVDLKSKRVFLKRGVYDQDGPLRLEELYIGGYITICSRRMKVIAYSDSATRAMFEKQCEQVFTVLSPAAYQDAGRLISNAALDGLTIKRLKTIPQSQQRRPALCLELVGSDAVNSWRRVCEKSVSSRTVEEAISTEVSGPEADRKFQGKECTATFSNCSLCIIRPHAVREGLAGEVISTILAAGFEITAMQSFSMIKAQAENFYEVYKTIVPSAHYISMVSELSSGLCIAMEVRAANNPVPLLRELCGPYDVEIARHLRPDTLRARLGRDNVHNAVHCTDLAEDGPLECQYFFSILPMAS